jgi:hypothetical protein
VVAAWLAGQRSSAVADDGEARRAGVLVRRRASGDALGQWGMASSDRGARGSRETGGAGEAVTVGQAQASETVVGTRDAHCLRSAARQCSSSTVVFFVPVGLSLLVFFIKAASNGSRISPLGFRHRSSIWVAARSFHCPQFLFEAHHARQTFSKLIPR